MSSSSIRFSTVEVADDSSGVLVLSKKNEEKNDYTSSMPPWFRRSEESTPDMIEAEVDSLIMTLNEYDLSEHDISDIVKAIYLTASGNIQLLIGAIEFCKLILRMEDPREGYTNVLVSKDLILASIIHYSECVVARQDGVYQDVQKALGGSQPDSPMVLAFPVAIAEDAPEIESLNKGSNDFFPKPSISLKKERSSSDETAFDIFSVESLRLAEEASRVKRAEILTDVVLTGRRVLSKGDYGDISNLLLSVSNDWRALAIRCIASLYRLEGILWDMPPGTGEYMRRDAAATFNARYSIRVYANLSQRMGLHRLQSQLEGDAFRILYPRQFSAVTTLFQQKEEAMRAVSTFLSSEITNLINSDRTLVEQLENCDIQARVKTPYSFWKKLVKKRGRGSNGTVGFLAPLASISVLDVLDGVALRVILKAETFPDDDDDLIDARERMLCYYVHHLIRSQWPETDAKRVKDYIKAPKPNGYQSLHHTSSIIYNGQQIPFEVQVRSEKMHRIAEFGIAAHWDYKANNRKLPLLSGSASSQDGKTIHDSEYIGALDTAREHLQGSSVYVFLAGTISDLEGGLLLSLQAGSQVVDILKELSSRFNIETSSHEFQVWRNGNLASPDDYVGNGDVVLFQSLSTNGNSSSDHGSGEKKRLSLPYMKADE
ncbi:unnamed protein product [Cylindrotheca closterium]|uniref:RelA/SpoT domain-containing protein n=1 Tax=Cylindrotheca closterium TaxID=2856 RepID=A0AAD2JLC5_9STRA|nr:unnamed protein product [Cylindrotheca closterium]